jgi:predicted AlkP superfamily phosphohydrolase/phosphomutase
MATSPRVFVFGLDGACPDLVLDRWRDELPVLAGLCDGATWGPLRSVHPPVTIPAWSSLVTGQDPGELGIYGFRSRVDRSYAAPRLCDANALETPTLWDLLGAEGLDSVVVGFPQSYPVWPLQGCMVTGLLTPPDARDTTWPPALRDEIRAWVGAYAFDVGAHRSGDRDRVREEARAMTRARFRVARELAQRHAWSFFFLHEIGLDRMQHAFGEGLVADGPEADVLLDYHRLLDAEIGETLDLLPAETCILVVSDHGARPLEGSFCLNDWLRREGYLVLREEPGAAGEAFEAERVDWLRTRAWGQGGYAGRIYLNVEGREPQGTLAASAARDTAEEIRGRLEAQCGPDGEPLGTGAYAPEEVWNATRGVPPDLLVYPGELALRCAETLGHDGVFLAGNDSGADSANHAWEGLFILRDPRRPGRGRVQGTHLLDVAPSLLERLGRAAPGWMRGGRIWA